MRESQGETNLLFEYKLHYNANASKLILITAPNLAVMQIDTTKIFMNQTDSWCVPTA